MQNYVELENELIYLGLLEKAREIYFELGERAVLSYIKSSHRLLSKVYHPDMNPENKDRAEMIQQRLNRLSHLISHTTDEELIKLIKEGAENKEKRKKIMVVEDEITLQELFKDVLIMEGYDVKIAQDGEIGYIEYFKFEPDLIIADVVVPKMSGLELVRKIREKHFGIKVIYISGFFGLTGLKYEIDKDVRNYGYPTISKPFKISHLLEVVNDYLNYSGTVKFYKGV